MPLMPASASAFSRRLLGANHRPRTQVRNAFTACSRVTWKGSRACGLIRRLETASATMGEPQKGQRSAVTLGGSVVSAPQVLHLTVRASSVGCSPATLASQAW